MLRREMTPQVLVERLLERAARRESLPVIVRPARTAAELDEVVALRAAGYGRHDPATAPDAPDPLDCAPNATVLVAICKRTARIVGSLRVVVNDGPAPLQCEPHLPVRLEALGRVAEALRLVIAPSQDSPLVKLALWKAFLQISLHRRVRNMVVAARRPIDDDYRAILFEDLGPEPCWFTPGHGFDTPHRLLRLQLEGLTSRPEAMAVPVIRFCYDSSFAADIRPLCEADLNPLARLADAAIRPRPSAPRETPRIGLPGLVAG